MVNFTSRLYTSGLLSIASDWLSLDVHSVLVNEDEFDLVTGVDVSLGNGVDDVLCSLLNLLHVLGKLLHEEVVSHELVVEDGCSELGARALHTIGELVK